MALRPVQVNIKAVDAPAVGRFWAEALGWSAFSPGVTTYVGPAGGRVWPEPVGLGIDVVPVPHPKTPTKNRLHLDLATTSTAHQAELVARLRSLGATPADVGQGDVPWTVLADPEGNEFCVLEPREIYRDTGPIAAVVVDCVDPRAMARFWTGATDWTLLELTPSQASLRSAEGVGPYLEFLRVPTPKTTRTASTWTCCPTRPTTRRRRRTACAHSARPTSTSARATPHGHACPTRRATSSASSRHPRRSLTGAPAAPGRQLRVLWRTLKGDYREWSG